MNQVYQSPESISPLKDSNPLTPDSLLVVDDAKVNRETLARRLVQEGYHVLTAEGGREALTAVGHGGVGLVLLDLEMPDMDGMAVLQELRKSHSVLELPVLIVSGNAESPQMVSALDRGANDYLTKPLDFQVLLAKVRRHLSLRPSLTSEPVSLPPPGILAAPRGPLAAVSDPPTEVTVRSDFDPRWGPPPPSWTPWALNQREFIEDLLQKQRGPAVLPRPDLWIDPVRQFLADRRSGYLILEGPSGCGKSLLGSYLESCAAQLSDKPLHYAYLRVAADENSQLLAELINEGLNQSRSPRAQRIAPLEISGLQELANQLPITDEANRAERVSAFLVSLSRHNRGLLVLFLDGLDDDALPALPDSLPENVYIILTSGLDKGRVERFLRSGAQHHRLDPHSLSSVEFVSKDLRRLPTFQQDENLLRQVLRRTDGVLFPAQIAAEAIHRGFLRLEGLPPPALADPAGPVLQELFKNWLTFAGGRQMLNLYLTLAASPQPVELQDLSQWGIDPQILVKALEWVPSTILLEQRSLSLSLTLGHESFSNFLRKTYKSEYSAVGRALCAWAVHQFFGSSGAANLDSDAVRERARLTLTRIYQWALVTEEVEVLEWVVLNKELAEKRWALIQALDAAGMFRQLLSFLDLWVTSLKTMVETHMAADLRDELGRALTERGRIYLECGHLTRSEADLSEAVRIYEVLVQGERKTQFRGGLAEAYSDRGKLHVLLGLHPAALGDTSKAIELLRLLVEDFGREDQRPRLAQTFALQARVVSQLGDPRDALTSGREALREYQALSGQSLGRTSKIRADHAQVSLLTARLALELGESKSYEQVVTDATCAIETLGELIERDNRQDLKADLGRAFQIRAQVYSLRSQYTLAAKDVAKSVQSFTELFDAGRLDIRDELCLAYDERAKISLASKLVPEALRDLSKAIDLRSVVLSEASTAPEASHGGGQKLRQSLVRSLLQRAKLFLEGEQLDQALRDYDKAVSVLEKHAPGANAPPPRELNDILLARSSCQLRRGLYAECITDARRVVESSVADWYSRAQGWSVIGQSESRQLHAPAARLALTKAMDLFYEQVKSNPTAGLLGELADCCANLSEAELLEGLLEPATSHATRAVDALIVLLDKDPSPDLQARTARALSCRGEAYCRLQQWARAGVDSQKAVEVLTGLVDTQHLETYSDKLALAQRRLAQLLLETGNIAAALPAAQRADVIYQKLWSKERNGPWLDELCRTYRLRSGILMAAKDYARAEEELGRAFEHFHNLVTGGRREYIEDLLLCYRQRAINFQRAGSLAKAADEYAKQAVFCQKLMAETPTLDLRVAVAQASHSQGRLAMEQKSLEVAFNSFAQSIQIYRKLVVEEGRIDLGVALADSYADRAKMLLDNGHTANAGADLNQAMQVLGVLLKEGKSESSRRMAQVALMRATFWQQQGSPNEALEDVNNALELLMNLVGGERGGEVVPELARALTQRARLWAQFQQASQAADDYSKALQLYTRLVDVEGRADLAAELAECLLAHLSFSRDPRDPANQEALARAVKLVLQQVKEGHPAPPGFLVDGLQAVAAMLTSDPSLESSEMTESVSKLVEGSVLNSRTQLDWVPVTDLLTECASLLDPMRHKKYVHFIVLACLTSQREVMTVGSDSLGRLVYFLHQLGLATEMSRSLPECIGQIGGCFTLIYEKLREFSDPQMQASLRDMVLMWRNLPPTMPAMANISRQMLTALARSF